MKAIHDDQQPCDFNKDVNYFEQLLFLKLFRNLKSWNIWDPRKQKEISEDSKGRKK